MNFDLVAIPASLVGLFLIFLRRSNVNRNPNLQNGALNSMAFEEQPVAAPEKEVTPQQAEALTKSLPLQEHFEIRDNFRSAEAFYAAGDTDQAERLYVQILSLDENHVDANTRLGIIYLKKNLPLKAEALYRKLLSLAPENAAHYSNLALSLYYQRRLEEAREMYLKAIELDGKRPQRFINLAQVYRDLKEHEKALEAAITACSLGQNNNEYKFALAEIYRDLGKLPEAREIVQIILREEPSESPIRPAARILLKLLEKDS